ncbi:tripartite tricarboxylate transporter substrate binding protein [Haloechinothrix salitolerans]|uniref:Bug family tripartite tricarboxylate transporter substrate binding protein n=1 Tax=Haloechinothrix salitolerans TaxID=926830 RepID=A0ABW2C731_9PSEU
MFRRFRTRPLIAGAAAASLFAVSACGASQAGDDANWTPSQPIEMVAPAETGGGWDTLARSASRILEDTGKIDQDMQVINKPGAGGAIGWAYVAGNAGDPHKLFVTSPPIVLVPLAGQSEVDHTDFTPIARLATDYAAYLVPADSPLKSFDDLVTKLKENPASLSIAGGSAPGSMDHVAVAGAANAAGVDASNLKYVPFDGGGEATTALLGGHVDVAVSGAGEITELAKSGKVRVLSVSSDERLDTLPDVPTLKEAGVDYTYDIWRGVMGPADLTDGQVAYYESKFEELTKTDAWRTEIAKYGWADSYLGSDEFGTFLDEQKNATADILGEIGLR